MANPIHTLYDTFYIKYLGDILDIITVIAHIPGMLVAMD